MAGKEESDGEAMDDADVLRPKRILITEKDSVLAAGLLHLLGKQAGLEVTAVGATEGPELLAALRAFGPDLVVAPCADFPHERSDQLAILREAGVSRLVCVSPDCNNAYVYDLSQVSITVVDDLLALIPTA